MRNKLLVAALVVVGLASIAYAAYAQTLIIQGTASATGNWDVEITSITKDVTAGSNVGATENTTNTKLVDKTKAQFDVGLAYPGAKATYLVKIENLGNIKAKLTSISGLNETVAPLGANQVAPTYIHYILTGVNPNDELAPGAFTTATVVAEWVAGTNPDTSSGTSKTATITFNYDQNP